MYMQVYVLQSFSLQVFDKCLRDIENDAASVGLTSISEGEPPSIDVPLQVNLDINPFFILTSYFP